MRAPPVASESRRPGHRRETPSIDIRNASWANPNLSTSAPSVHIQSSGCACGGGCPQCSTTAVVGRPGRPVEAGVRQRAESAYGADLRDVRVHTDAMASEAARQQGARAFTLGRDIYFGQGRYAPHTLVGQRRIAHELAHVVQQRKPRPRSGGGGAEPYAAAEREGWRAADAASSGSRINLVERSAGMPQRDGPAGTATPAPAMTPAPEAPDSTFWLRHYLRWWLGTTLTLGSPPSTVQQPASVPLPSATSVLGSPPLSAMVFQPNFFTPLPPTLVRSPDMSQLMAPYLARGVPSALRDPATAVSIYERQYAWVSTLPDLRALAPAVVRPLIPDTWRRSLAGTFTGLIINGQLNRDYPTPIEASDRAFEAMTGAKTTVFKLPEVSF